MRALYAVERQAKELSPARRLELRRSSSAPGLAGLREKFLGWKEQLLAQASDGERVLRRPSASIENNVSEREMKLVVLNRKNSLFVVCRQPARGQDGRDCGVPDQQLPTPRGGPATVPERSC